MSGRIVNNFGELIRMSERNYQRFLRDGAQHPYTVVPADYGKVIGTIDFTCTDATKSDYEMQQQMHPANEPGQHAAPSRRKP